MRSLVAAGRLTPARRTTSGSPKEWRAPGDHAAAIVSLGDAEPNKAVVSDDAYVALPVDRLGASGPRRDRRHA